MSITLIIKPEDPEVKSHILLSLIYSIMQFSLHWLCFFLVHIVLYYNALIRELTANHSEQLSQMAIAVLHTVLRSVHSNHIEQATPLFQGCN